MKTDQKSYEEIIDTYRQTHSIARTAAACHVSIVKTRRVLITENLWASRSSREIDELYNQGLSTEEIAGKLSMTVKNVQAYLPYSRGTYHVLPETKSALNSKAYRTRNNQIREKMVYIQKSRKGETMSEKTKETPKRRKFEKNHPEIMHLHLELVQNSFDENDISYPDQEQQRVLSAYGNVKYGKTISRDILVPADISLYSLHYVIQRLFGWQNSHLHDFSLPTRLMRNLTDDKIGKWASLAGLLFRYPDLDENSRFWMDDYEGGSFRTWLRRKYTGPYINRSQGEDFLTTLRNVEKDAHHFPYVSLEYEDYNGISHLTNADFLKDKADQAGPSESDDDRSSFHATVFGKDAPVHTLRYFYQNDPNTLLERLTLSELMTVSPAEIRYQEYMAELIPQIMEYLSKEHPGFEDQPHLIPFTDTLIYTYDYGDDWKIKITVSDPACRNLIKAHRLTKASLQEAQNSLKDNYRPVCIAADGLNVMDDAGGLEGYACFLRSIHPDEETEYMHQNHIDPDDETIDNGPYTEKQDSLSWAQRNFGWKNKMPDPERIL